MTANEFFHDVEQCCRLGCNNVIVNAEGIQVQRIRYHSNLIECPESLLMLKDIYTPEAYMYARLRPCLSEIDILDSNDRELGDWRIERVSMNGSIMIIDARISGSD